MAFGSELAIDEDLLRGYDFNKPMVPTRINPPEPSLQAGGGGINYDSSTAITVPTTVAPVLTASQIAADIEAIRKNLGPVVKQRLGRAGLTYEYPPDAFFSTETQQRALNSRISKYLQDNKIPLYSPDGKGGIQALNVGPVNDRARTGSINGYENDFTRAVAAQYGPDWYSNPTGPVGEYSVPLNEKKGASILGFEAQPIVQAITTAINPPMGAAFSGALAAQSGGNLEDILKAAGTTYLSGELSGYAGDAAGAATSAYGPVVSGAASGAAGSAVNTAVQGGDLSEIAQAGLFGGLGGAGSAYVNDFVTGVQADNLGLDTQAGIDAAIASGDIGQIGTSYGNYNEVPDNVDQRIWDEEFSLGTPEAGPVDGYIDYSTGKDLPQWLIDALKSGTARKAEWGEDGLIIERGDRYILEPVVEETKTDAGGGGGGGGAGGGAGVGGGAIPKVEPVPEPVDEAIPEEKQRDDIVAVQLQEAIDWETDPELKAALEAELERYTKPSVDDAPN
jgi:hypothetical protein